MTISKDRVKPSPLPDSWKLKEIFATGVVLGGYQALMTVVFFWLMSDTSFFEVNYQLHQSALFTSFMNSSLLYRNLPQIPDLSLQNHFHVKQLTHGQMMAALYLQVSVISQALIFVTRSRSWSYVERPGWLLGVAFLVAQLVNFVLLLLQIC